MTFRCNPASGGLIPVPRHHATRRHASPTGGPPVVSLSYRMQLFPRLARAATRADSANIHSRQDLRPVAAESARPFKVDSSASRGAVVDCRADLIPGP